MTNYKLKATINTYNYVFEQDRLYIVYPELKDQVKQYLNLIEKSSNQILLGNFGQVFGIPINTGIGDDSYLLSWKIDANILKNHRSRKIDITQPDLHSQENHLDKSKVDFYSRQKFTTPIIIGWHLPIMTKLVIDGNHRFHAAHKRGDKYIDAIILEPHEHFAYLLSEQAKKLYIVHHNLFVLMNHCKFPIITINTNADTTLRLRSFYDLDDNVPFTMARKLKLITKRFWNK